MIPYKFVLEFFILIIIFALVMRLSERKLYNLLRQLIDRLLDKR
jgi:hypothetical protein